MPDPRQFHSSHPRGLNSTTVPVLFSLPNVQPAIAAASLRANSQVEANADSGKFESGNRSSTSESARSRTPQTTAKTPLISKSASNANQRIDAPIVAGTQSDSPIPTELPTTQPSSNKSQRGFGKVYNTTVLLLIAALCFLYFKNTSKTVDSSKTADLSKPSTSNSPDDSSDRIAKNSTTNTVKASPVSFGGTSIGGTTAFQLPGNASNSTNNSAQQVQSNDKTPLILAPAGSKLDAPSTLTLDKGPSAEPSFGPDAKTSALDGSAFAPDQEFKDATSPSRDIRIESSRVGANIPDSSSGEYQPSRTAQSVPGGTNANNESTTATVISSRDPDLNVHWLNQVRHGRVPAQNAVNSSNVPNRNMAVSNSTINQPIPGNQPNPSANYPMSGQSYPATRNANERISIPPYEQASRGALGYDANANGLGNRYIPQYIVEPSQTNRIVQPALNSAAPNSATAYPPIMPYQPIGNSLPVPNEGESYTPLVGSR